MTGGLRGMRDGGDRKTFHEAVRVVPEPVRGTQTLLCSRRPWPWGYMGSCVQSVSRAPGRGRAGAQWAGPCVPRLAPLYQVLQPMAGCARVLQCAQAVPTLLQVFFSAVTQVSPLPRPRSHGRGPVASRTAALTMEELQLRGGGGEEERHLQPHPGPVPLAQASLSPGWRRDSQDQGRGSRSRCSVAGLSRSLDPSSPTGL